jgi:hypothetical protein
MSGRDIWDGRPVNFASLSIREGEPIIDTIAAGQARAGRYALLVATMRWADTEEPVFTSVDEIYAQPLRFWLVLQRLAAKAAYANGLQDADPDAPLPGASNGHDGSAASPSP